MEGIKTAKSLIVKVVFTKYLCHHNLRKGPISLSVTIQYVGKAYHEKHSSLLDPLIREKWGKEVFINMTPVPCSKII